jgi:cell division inhibitor SulA
MTAKQMFVLLLKLYPPDHRAVFGEEMLAVLEQAAKRQTGLPGSIVFFALEAMGLLRGAAREWAAVLTAGRQPLRQEVIAHDGLPDDLRVAQIRADAAIREMVQAISSGQFERARRWSDLERRERDRLRKIREEYGLGDEPAGV